MTRHSVMAVRQSFGDADRQFTTRVVRGGAGPGEDKPAHVLALHSLGLDAHAFDALQEAVGMPWCIVSYDQSGHGSRAGDTATDMKALVDDAQAVLADCGEQPVHLVGHSMGGAVAALLASRLAASTPGRIASLTLLSTPANGGAAFVQRGADVLSNGMESAISQTMARWFGEAGAAVDAVPQRYARDCLQALQPAGLAAAWNALSEFPGYASLAVALPPTLCIAAEDDLSTPPKAMQAIADAFASAGRADAMTFSTLPGGGHMAPLFATPALVSALQVHWRAHTAA